MDGEACRGSHRRKGEEILFAVMIFLQAFLLRDRIAPSEAAGWLPRARNVGLFAQIGMWVWKGASEVSDRRRLVDALSRRMIR